MEDLLLVAEVFGPTFQGEGPSIGQRAAFVRLSGCNLACSWCDTPYTWDWSRFDPKAESRRMTVTEIIETIRPMRPHVVVITGGEPLLQAAKVASLAYACAANGWRSEVETNGTIAPIMDVARAVTYWNVSPKLAHAGDALDKRFNRDALGVLLHLNARFKFVCASPRDLAEVGEIARVMAIPPRAVWIMPEGTNELVIRDRLKELAGPVLEAGYNLTTRLQIQLWGNERGR